MSLRILDEAAGVDFRPTSIRAAIAFLLDLDALGGTLGVPPPVHTVRTYEVGHGKVRFRLRDGRNPRISAPFCGDCNRKSLNRCHCPEVAE